MNWKQVSDLYIEDIKYLKPIPKDRAMLEYNYLRENINSTFPEAIENPALITSTDWKVLIKTLTSTTAESNLQFRRSGDALDKVHRIIKKYKDLPPLNHSLDASKKALRKEQIVYCFAEFLKKNDMQNITTSLLQTCEADVIAVKDDIKFFALAIGSPAAFTNEDIKTKDRITLFKTDFALTLLVLMEKMTADPAVTASILIADDKASKELIANYQHILKADIKIFLVKSVDEVEMLEAD